MQVAGGVGRNMALALSLMLPSDKRPLLISVVGNDEAGEMLVRGLETSGYVFLSATSYVEVEAMY
jgi:sugar/nucleoside kinase (ribokinase family)